MIKSSISNFNYAIFLNFLLLVLVVSVTRKQSELDFSLNRYEKLLIINKLFSLDSLFVFDSIVGTPPDKQVRVRRSMKILEHDINFTSTLKPVNEIFIETAKLPSRGLAYRNRCNNDSILIKSDNIDKEFLVYKVRILNDEFNKSKMLFPGFTLYFSNTSLIESKYENQPCMAPVGRIMYLEDRSSDYPLASFNKVDVERELSILQSSKNTEGENLKTYYSDKLDSNEPSVVKVPLVEINVDIKRSRNLLLFFSLCITAFIINMFRKIIINFRQQKDEMFLLKEVTKDAFDFYKRSYKMELFKLDSFFILFYYLISFLSPLLILILLLYNTEIYESFGKKDFVFIFLSFLMVYYLINIFFLYYKLISIHVDREFPKKVIEIFRNNFDEDDDKLFTDIQPNSI